MEMFWLADPHWAYFLTIAHTCLQVWHMNKYVYAQIPEGFVGTVPNVGLGLVVLYLGSLNTS